MRSTHLLPVSATALAFALLSTGGACVTPTENVPEDAATEDTADALPCTPGYPLGPFGREIGSILANESFVTDRGTVELASYYTPCAARANVLVVRVTSGFCGSCRWHAEHTQEFLAVDDRVKLLDLLVSDDENFVPTLRAVDTWRKRLSVDIPVALNPSQSWATFDGLPAAGFPLYVFIDPRTMELRGALQNPGPERVKSRILSELAAIDGKEAPSPLPEEKIQNYFSRDQWDMLKAMKRPTVPPPDPTNAYADNADAAAFGRQLFFDTSLSPTNTVSCSTCHMPAKGLTDRLPQGVGVGKGDRKTPSIMFAAHSPTQFWDGRADSLWAQALGPLEAPLEFGSSRTFVAKQVYAKHKGAYEKIFGALPDFADPRFPPTGKPGEPAYDALSAADREAITKTFVNVGKSIAAYERTFQSTATRVDAYIAGDFSALTDNEAHGFHEYFAAGCAQCHFGPRLTNDAFHNLRFPTGKQDGTADIGRSDGITSLLASEFNRAGSWSDKKEMYDVAFLLANAKSAEGKFRTPSLWGIGVNAPFGHGGTLATMEEIVKIYADRGLADGDARTMGQTEPWVPKFSEEHRPRIVTFLKLLTNEAIAP